VPGSSGTNLIVTFNDQNDNDGFWYEVWYAIVPNSCISSAHDLGSPSAENFAVFAGNISNAVLTGFHLDFDPPNFDHHIDMIEVDLFDGEGRVALNDEENDDEFSWWVAWGNLMP
jgi:hypothetical protein